MTSKRLRLVEDPSFNEEEFVIREAFRLRVGTCMSGVITRSEQLGIDGDEALFLIRLLWEADEDGACIELNKEELFSKMLNYSEGKIAKLIHKLSKKGLLITFKSSESVDIKTVEYLDVWTSVDCIFAKLLDLDTQEMYGH